MTLPELSVRRHVMAYMLSGLLILFGIISYQSISVDRFSAIEFPMLSITTALPGANPSVVDASVTNVIESVVNAVSGIESIQSSSLPGVSVVMIQFELEKEIDVAFNEVQAKVNEVLRDLSDDADPPVVAKVQVGGTPIMWLALQGDRTLQQLNQYARNVIKKRLETISGVGEVRIGGERERTIRVHLDPLRMTNLSLSVQDVIAAFRREHIKIPGGFLTGPNRKELIKLDLEFHNLEDLKHLVVTHRGHLPVHLHEIAEVEDGLADARRFASYNGQPAVGLGIVKISNANTVAIIDEVKRRLDEEILPQLPPGMTLSIAADDAAFILKIVDSLQEHLLEGTLLAAFVVWLFLKSLRSTLIIATAIPVTLLGAIAAIFFAGYSGVAQHHLQPHDFSSAPAGKAAADAVHPYRTAGGVFYRLSETLRGVGRLWPHTLLCSPVPDSVAADAGRALHQDAVLPHLVGLLLSHGGYHDRHLLMYQMTGLVFFQTLAYGLLVLVTILVVYLAIRTLLEISRRQICVEEA